MIAQEGSLKDGRRTVGLTLGCWDGLHEGHRNHLRACADFLRSRAGEGGPEPLLIIIAMGDLWIRVGKGAEPLAEESARLRELEAFARGLGVSAAVVPRNRPRIPMREGAAVDVLFVGPDQDWHVKTPRNRRNLAGCEVVTIPRTPGVSSTELRNVQP